MAKKRILGITCIAVIVVAVAFLWWPHDRESPKSPAATVSRVAAQQACIQKLPLAVKIGQKLMIASYAGQVGAAITAVGRYDIGGVIVMDAISSDDIVRLKEAYTVAPFIAVDQEGGTVQRYKGAGPMLGATDTANSLSPAAAYAQYSHDAEYLKTIGITTNFAPVVDVESREPSPLPGRMYSNSANVVVSYATQAIRAYKDAGITPVIKHFPGLGSATGNTDFTGATTDPLATLDTRDIVPYRDLATFSPDAMVSSAIVPGLTDGQPALWSSTAVTMLRKLGYQHAIIYTDSLTAAAVPGSLADAVVKAWEAGIDVALIVQKDGETPAISNYIPQITGAVQQALDARQLQQSQLDSSLQRIFTRKQVDPCKLPA